uniref:Uncharacterized protein n=1 Tax=Pipistrellus kuhlii TaxID=59472 RepID=A0A7J7RN19_PIPKU|nr:hypothetical protein mPipKuh1_010392 [Pipistrellus kuhlii]
MRGAWRVFHLGGIIPRLGSPYFLLPKSQESIPPWLWPGGTLSQKSLRVYWEIFNVKGRSEPLPLDQRHRGRAGGHVASGGGVPGRRGCAGLSGLLRPHGLCPSPPPPAPPAPRDLAQQTDKHGSRSSHPQHVTRCQTH